jgi:hypothetical protein
MNVRILKLISGEELICDVTIDEGESALMSIKEVAQVAMRSNEEGKVQVGMAPFMPYAEEPMTINVNSIALSAEPSRELLNEYNKIFGSGIQLATPNEIASIR